MARVMAVDYGTVRTGVAFSDLTRSIVGETLTIAERNFRRLVSELAALVLNRDVNTIVLGCPLNMDDSENELTRQCKKLADMLTTATGLQVVLEDERLTSFEAQAILRENGHKFIPGKTQKGTVDALSAALILETYLMNT